MNEYIAYLYDIRVVCTFVRSTRDRCVLWMARRKRYKCIETRPRPGRPNVPRGFRTRNAYVYRCARPTYTIRKRNSIKQFVAPFGPAAFRTVSFRNDRSTRVRKFINWLLLTVYRKSGVWCAPKKIATENALTSERSSTTINAGSVRVRTTIITFTKAIETRCEITPFV